MALQDWPWAMVAMSALFALATYCIARWIQARMFFRNLPGPPHSFFWGHLKILGDAYASLPSDVHYQVAVTAIARKYDLPGVWYLDLWPAADGQIVATDPDLANYITNTKNYPKHEAEKYFIDPLIGDGNIVTTNGGRWKDLHKMLSPAFSVQHVGKLRPIVAAEVMKFRSNLQKKAESGEAFKLEELVQCLTFDIIGTATFGRSLDAQTHGNPVLQHFENMCRLWMRSRESWNIIRNLLVNRKRDAQRKTLDDEAILLVKERFQKVQQEKLDLSEKKGLGIMDLILRDYVEELRRSGKKEMDEEFLRDALTQVKTLLLAGTGTTSDTLCFALMLMSVHPQVVQKLREEHDRVFTPGIEETYQMMCKQPSKISELAYTTSVIKETLRLYPIGNTARAGADSIPFQGRDYPAKGLMINPVGYTMHMDPKIFSNPKAFDPDRFDREDFPRHAWRPFERGPRACLGQTFAMDELKIILLLIVRDFDFTCAHLKPAEKPRFSWFDLDTLFGDRAFQEFVFEAKPRDGMPMVIKKSSWPS